MNIERLILPGVSLMQSDVRIFPRKKLFNTDIHGVPRTGSSRKKLNPLFIRADTHDWYRRC